MSRSRADRLVAKILQLIQPLADDGDNMARHWIAVKRGDRSPGGRKPTDDGAALARIEELERDGRGREAVSIVAREMAKDPKDVTAIQRRLRRKRRK